MKTYVGKIIFLDDSPKGEIKGANGNSIPWERIDLYIVVPDDRNTIMKNRLVRIGVPGGKTTWNRITNNKPFNDYMSGEHEFFVTQEYNQTPNGPKPKAYETLTYVR